MNHPIPSHLITKANITQEIEGHPFEYTLTFTVFGEVLSVQHSFSENDDFLKLPTAAQELLLGENALDVYRRIKSQAILWKYELLFNFMALGFKKHQSYHQLMKLRENNPDYRKLDATQYIQSDWAKAVYLGMEKQEVIYQLKFLRLCFFTNYVFRINNFHLSDYDTQLVLPPLLTIGICSYYKTGDRRKLVPLLRIFPKEDTFNFLAEQLNNKELKFIHSSVIYALHTAIHPKLKPLLSAYFKRNPQINGVKNLLDLVEKIQPIPQAEVSELMEIINYHEEKVREEIFQDTVKKSKWIKVGMTKWVDIILENRTIIKEIARKAKDNF